MAASHQYNNQQCKATQIPFVRNYNNSNTSVLLRSKIIIGEISKGNYLTTNNQCISIIHRLHYRVSSALQSAISRLTLNPSSNVSHIHNQNIQSSVVLPMINMDGVHLHALNWKQKLERRYQFYYVSKIYIWIGMRNLGTFDIWSIQYILNCPCLNDTAFPRLHRTISDATTSIFLCIICILRPSTSLFAAYMLMHPSSSSIICCSMCTKCLSEMMTWR
jgi:hypothetical protein